MKRGLIVSVEKDCYQVMDLKGVFYTVKRAVDPDLPAGEELFWTDEWEMIASTEAEETGDWNTASAHHAKPLANWSSFGGKWTAVAASVMFLMFFGWWMFTGQVTDQDTLDRKLTPGSDLTAPLPDDPRVAAYITVDINPSVEIAVDAQDLVLFVRPVNTDGAELIAQIDFEGLPVTEAAEKLIIRAEEKGYLSSSQDVVLAVATAHGRASSEEGTSGTENNGNESGEVKIPPNTSSTDERLTRLVTDSIIHGVTSVNPEAAEKLKLTSISVPVELRKEANDHALSMGKLSIYLQAANRGKNLDMAELRKKPIKEIAQPFGGINQLLLPDVKEMPAVQSNETILRLLEEQKPELDQWKNQLKQERTKDSDNKEHEAEEQESGQSRSGDSAEEQHAQSNKRQDEHQSKEFEGDDRDALSDFEVEQEKAQSRRGIENDGEIKNADWVRQDSKMMFKTPDGVQPKKTVNPKEIRTGGKKEDHSRGNRPEKSDEGKKQKESEDKKRDDEKEDSVKWPKDGEGHEEKREIPSKQSEDVKEQSDGWNDESSASEQSEKKRNQEPYLLEQQKQEAAKAEQQRQEQQKQEAAKAEQQRQEQQKQAEAVLTDDDDDDDDLGHQPDKVIPGRGMPPKK